MNKSEFIEYCKSLNIKLNEDMLNKLSLYADTLISYNEHTNLTAITESNQIYLKHFYDSLTIAKAIDLNTINSLIDIGTGAGFPGMVLAICFPSLQVTLLDSNNKKTTFLEHLKNVLKIENVEIIYARSEEYGKKVQEMYDVVTSRAVTTLPALVELCLPLAKINGYFIPLKGDAEHEINISEDIIKKLNGNIEEIITFNLPVEESLRTIIKIKKINSTPKGYPRNYAAIKKSVEKLLKIK